MPQNLNQESVQNNLQEYITKIKNDLESHRRMVKLGTSQALTDSAVLSEDFYCDFLNVLMGWDLKNANIERKGFPGVDLIDVDNGIIVQVSTVCSRNKIQDSIKKYDKDRSEKDGAWHFYFVPLSDTIPKYRDEFSVPHDIDFNPETDVLTDDQIIQLARDKSRGNDKLYVDRLRSVSDTLDKLMREQEDHDEVCSYLLEVLEKKRASHPSFTLLGNDDIDRRPFPGIEESKVMPAVGEKDGAVAPIWDLIEEEQKEGFRHIVIEGTGGIGKSVSLLSVTDKEELLMRIPAIYIHMYDLVSNGTCITIWEHIQKYYSIHLDTIKHMVSRAGKPKLMVLLDGLNEVAFEMQTRLSRDIQSWAESNPGVQLIIASRPIPGKQLEYMFGPKTRSIRLKQLDWNDVQQYLALRDIPVPEESSKLGETIKLPLFLTLYAKTAKLNGKEAFEGCPLHVREAVGPASLVWNYLQRELLKQQTRDDVITCALSCELLAPYIAYRMEARNLFEIGCEQADDLVAEAVALLDANHLPRHASSALSWFKRQTHGAKPLPGTNWAERVLDECGIFVPPKKKNSGSVSDGQKSAEADYAFMHQNFRDCLAALHLVNAAEMADGQLPEEWKKSIRQEVLQYAAELMEKDTAAKLWEANRAYRQYTGGKPKDNTSTYMQLELNRLLGTPGDSLDFSGMDLRGMSLTGYMGSDQDLGLFGKPELSRGAHIDRKVFENVGHTSWVNCLAVLPDGRIVSGSDDKTLRIWDPDTGESFLMLKEHPGRIRCLAALSDGHIVSGSTDGNLRIWNPDTGECLWTLGGHAGWVNCLAVLHNGHIISGSNDRTLRIWDPDAGECLRTLKGHTDWVNCLAALPDGRIVSGSWDRTIRIWNADTGECLQALEGHPDWVNCVAALIDGNIVSGSDDNTLRIWDANTGECLRTLEGHTDWVTCLTFLRNGRIVSGSNDRTLRIWDPDTGKCLRTLKGHAGWINCLAVLPDRRIVSGSNDKTLRIWDPDTGECLRILEGHDDMVRCLASLHNGRILSGSDDGTLCIWNADTAECLRMLERHDDWIRCLASLHDGRIVSGSNDRTLRIWDGDTRKCMRELKKKHADYIRCLAVLHNGRIVSGSGDRTILIWNPDTGECLRTLEGHIASVNCLAVLPNDRIVSGSDDRFLRIWDPSTSECLKTLEGHSRPVNCLAVLPDRRIVSGSDDRTLRIWNPDTGECLRKLKEHTDSVKCLAVLFDRYIVSGAYDKTLRIWDPNTGKCLRTLDGQTGRISCIATLPDGRIISGSSDSKLRIWDPETGKCLDVLEATDVDVSHMYLSDAVMDEDTARILYQNMAQDHGEFAKRYRRTGGNA